MSWLCENEPERCAGRARFGTVGGPRGLTLVATILGSSMTFIDATVVNVALPAIGEDLGLGLTGRQWVFLTYSLALASLYLAAGGIADRIGLRRAFTMGVVGFAAASVLAGAAPNGAVLLVARTLQGVAGAFLTTSSLALLRATFANESGRAIGLWTAWTGVSTLAGPPLGGALVEWVSWRWIFFINLPVAVAAAVLALAGRTRDETPPVRRPLDPLGSVLTAVGIGSLTYALVEGVWWATGVAVAGLVAFFVHERRTDEPMLPLAVFRRRNFVVANAVTLLVYAALSGSTFYLVLYLQTVIGYTAFEASFVMVPLSVIMFLLAGRFGRLADERGPRLFLSTGPVLMAAGMLAWLGLDERSDWLALAAGVVLFSLGLAVTVAPITATALSSVPSSLAGVAAGFNNTVSRVGGLLAVAVIGVVISAVFTGAVDGSSISPLADPATSGAVRDASIDAFRAGLLVAAALSLLGALVAAVGISDPQARAEAHPVPA